MKRAKAKYFAERLALRHQGIHHATEESLRRMHQSNARYLLTLGPSLAIFCIGWFGHYWWVALAGGICVAVSLLLRRFSS